MINRIFAVLLFLVVLLMPESGKGQKPTEVEDLVGPRKAWQRVLEKYHKDGGLDYGALQQGRQDLDVFLGSLESAEPHALGVEEQIAFWVNAYNAVVVHHVLKRYPELDSVKDVEGFFEELRYPVAGQQLTLDEIEGRARALGDARIHFAVSLSPEKLPAGPIWAPRPGPILASDAAAPETEVNRSSPVMPNITEISPSVTMKNTKKDITEFSVSSGTGRPA